MSKRERAAELLVAFYEEEANGDPQELIRVHPDLADELRAQLRAAHAVDAAYAGALPPVTPYSTRSPCAKPCARSSPASP